MLDSLNTQYIDMPLFKRSSKNQSSSAASTPAQTPRVSLEDRRPVQPTEKMTRDQAFMKVTPTIMSNTAAAAYVR
ncbi:hypothetical protein BGX20_005469 [Mortierella sp. AD010]|nr:hypothetical protein BGX20_005469 [Mortierella sp. AD010]